MRFSASLIAAVTLAACAPAMRPAPVSSLQPLQAELRVGPQGLEVALSEPARVAVFAVVPGVGTYVVYPRPHEVNRVFAAGQSLLRAPGERGSLTQFAAVQQLLTNQNSLLVLVAGRGLDVERYVEAGTPGELRRAMGAQAFRADNESEALARLAEVVAGDLPQESWALDVRSVPAGELRRSIGRGRMASSALAPRRAPFYLVSCAEGGMSLANGVWGSTGCPTSGQTRALRRLPETRRQQPGFPRSGGRSAMPAAAETGSARGGVSTGGGVTQTRAPRPR